MKRSPSQWRRLGNLACHLARTIAKYVDQQLIYGGCVCSCSTVQKFRRKRNNFQLKNITLTFWLSRSDENFVHKLNSGKTFCFEEDSSIFCAVFFLGQEKDISRSYDTRNNNHRKTNETTSAIRIGDQISYFVIAPEKRRWEILKIEAIFTGAICIR